MPLQATSGAASYDAFGGGVAVVPNYIEEVFSTWLYPSINGDNQIVNSIDLTGKGGLVCIKRREGAGSYYLIDTVRGSSLGNTNSLSSNTTTAQSSGPYLDWLQFNNNGFTAKAVAGGGELGTNTYYGNMASLTFRKQPNFFDVVTYTGDGTSLRAISHNLASAPGCVIIKGTSSSTNWRVYHRSLGASQQVVLNATDAADSSGNLFGSPPTAPTSSDFYVGADSESNGSGQTYVACLFAHNAGGFGLTGTDNVISCGSFTNGSGATATITLGYEPQFVILKPSSGTGNWITLDTMRGWSQSTDALLFPNTSGAEVASELGYPTATGFNITGGFSSTDYIYIAIRRGPMKVPTDATKVFSPNAVNVGQGTQITTNFPVDMALASYRLGAGSGGFVAEDRLRGFSQLPNDTATEPYLSTYSTAAEATGIGFTYAWNNKGFLMNGAWASLSDIFYSFQRAPSFFDEVCYTGTGVARTVTHNLGVAPELMIVKSRSLTSLWPVYVAATGATKTMDLSSTGAATTLGAPWGGTSPTASVFTITGGMNTSGATYVAYLFASAPGVSKVGSYTGTGTTQTIDCGFTAGSRFVLIKRTDSTGGWYVWDSARGIVAGTDPYLLLNSTAAEVTSTDYVDTYSAGFELTSTAPAALNASGGSYIFLAIA